MEFSWVLLFLTFHPSANDPSSNNETHSLSTIVKDGQWRQLKGTYRLMAREIGNFLEIFSAGNIESVTEQHNYSLIKIINKYDVIQTRLRVSQTLWLANKHQVITRFKSQTKMRPALLCLLRCFLTHTNLKILLKIKRILSLGRILISNNLCLKPHSAWE